MNPITIRSRKSNNLCEIFPSYEIVEHDIFFSGKIINISNRGMCFESDSLFLPKQTIKVKIPGIIYNPETDALRYHNATVKWSKHRHYSTFQNCYGVEFTEPLHNIEKFVLHTETIKQTSLLLNISAISGMLVFLVYFFIKLFFGLKSVSVPFELIIFGFGLIGFKRFIRCNAKALKTRPEKRILKKNVLQPLQFRKKAL